MTAIRSDRVDFQFSPETVSKLDFENAVEFKTNQNMAAKRPNSAPPLPRSTSHTASTPHKIKPNSSPAVAAHARQSTTRADVEMPTRGKWLMAAFLVLVTATVIPITINEVNKNSR